MAIYKSSVSGTPFGDTSARPSSPSVGQTYYNGELGYQEIYTNSGWIPSSGGNDFNLNISGTYTSVTFTQSYAVGSYSIVSGNNDSSIDIYAYAGDGSLAGYTGNKNFTSTKRFNKMVVIGGTNGDILTFTYKPTFTASSTTSETSAPAWISSVSTSSLPNQNNTTNITGGNFAENVAVTFTGTDNVERNAKTIVRNSVTSLTVTRPDILPPTASPFSIKVVNPDVLNLPTSTNVHILSNAITAGAGPVWSTSATLSSFTQNVSYSTTLVATDADASSTLSYSVVSGSLPNGLSLESSTGIISGTPTVAGTNTFTVRVTDSGGNYVDRAFTTTQAVPNPPTITSAGDVGTGRAYNNGSATISFNAPAYTGTSSITSYTVTASTGQTASGSSSPIVVTGIATGATPTFTVTATNTAGTSLSSSASASVTITTVPAAPTIGTATRVANNSVSLSFTEPSSNGGKTISSYVASSSPSISLTTTGSSSPLSISGSFAGSTNYSFQVAAVNDNGTSAYSSESNSIIVTYPTISGGTLTSDSTYYYRTFTSTDSISVSVSSALVDALIVAGGGGGVGKSGTRYGQNSYGGSGGAGGTRIVSGITLPVGSTTITIGSGGAGTTSSGQGGNGTSSSVGGTSNVGGGGGGNGVTPANGSNGGSGGGCGGWVQYKVGSATALGGSGTAGQGYSGASNTFGGGGGGASSAGSSTTGGNSSTLMGYTVGAGGSQNGATANSNTGNGGPSSSTNGSTGGSGGSGLVVIRYAKSLVGG